MEMVSASKMKKAQGQALATRPFSDKLEAIIDHIVSSGATLRHPLMEIRSTRAKAMLIIVSTDKGLCGGLNVNLFKAVSDWAKNSPHKSLEIVHVRKKAKTTVGAKDWSLKAVFHDIGETPTFEETRAIAKLAMDSFLQGEVDEVYTAYPKFISTLTSQPTIKKILPVTSSLGQVQTNSEYLFEPTPASLIQELFPYMVEMSVYQIMIDSSASEHSARMVAMKNASDNALELIGNLTLDYNQARQSQVTSELLDATTARMALA